jgi:hypothetical protein
LENKPGYSVSNNTIFGMILLAVISLLVFRGINYKNALVGLENYENSLACTGSPNPMGEKQCRQILSAEVVDSKIMVPNIILARASRMGRLRYFLVLSLPNAQVEEVELLADTNIPGEKAQYVENQPYTSTFYTYSVVDNIHTKDRVVLEYWDKKITLVFALSTMGDEIAIPTTWYPEYIVSKERSDLFGLAILLSIVLLGIVFYWKLIRSDQERE